MFRTVARYEDDTLGLPYPITLIDAVEEEVENGEVVGISIPNMEGLVAAVAATRCLIPQRMKGDELRFIRGVIGKGSAEFAKDLEMDPATYSRWENDKGQCGAWAEKSVRALALMILGDRVPHLSLDPKDIVSLRFIGPDVPFSIEMVLTREMDAKGSPSLPILDWDTTFRLAA